MFFSWISLLGMCKSCKGQKNLWFLISEWIVSALFQPQAVSWKLCQCVLIFLLSLWNIENSPVCGMKKVAIGKSIIKIADTVLFALPWKSSEINNLILIPHKFVRDSDRVIKSGFFWLWKPMFSMCFTPLLICMSTKLYRYWLPVP